MVFDGEEGITEAIAEGRVKDGSVVIIRYVGPKGGPGMPEMLAPQEPSWAQASARQFALITDGRFSGASHGFCTGHVVPEAAEGGPIALVKDGIGSRSMRVRTRSTCISVRRRWRRGSSGGLGRRRQAAGQAQEGMAVQVCEGRAECVGGMCY